jgi:polysaccharide export outer membrane protein
MKVRDMRRVSALFFAVVSLWAVDSAAQARADDRAAAPIAPTVARTAVPSDYVIGPDDILQLVFWREKDLSVEVTVRPDGMISVPLVNDISALGLTPDQLRERLMEAARRYTQDPAVTVVVKQINSRRVFITGEVSKPGLYPLTAPMTVLQLIALAGGLDEFADSKNIRIMRTDNGRPMSYKFDYKAVAAGRQLDQNIDLRPGDTVVVP